MAKKFYSGVETNTLKVTGGTIASGNILQSDGSGNATWQTPSAGSGDMVLASIQTVTGAKTFNSGKLLLAGATSGAATLNAPAVAGSIVLTLPSVTDTLAGLASVQTITGAWTFNDGKLVLAGATSGTSTLKAAAVAGTTTLTLPSITDTLAGLASVQTITGAWTFTDGKLVLAGATSGTSTLKAPAVAGTTTHTLPSTSDTLVGVAATQSLTNKDTTDATNTAPFRRVIHGATASTARPLATHVEWVGSVTPTNATSVDTWIDTA